MRRLAAPLTLLAGFVSGALIAHVWTRRNAVAAMEEVIDFIFWDLDMQGVDIKSVFDSTAELRQNNIGPSDLS